MTARACLILPIVAVIFLFSVTAWGQSTDNADRPTYTINFDVVGDRVSVKVVKEGKTIHDHELRWKVQEMEQQVRKFVSAFQNTDSITAEFLKRFDPNLAKTLYIELLSQALEKVPAGANLRIVPDYFLAVIPFEALVVNGTPHWQDENGQVRICGPTYLGDMYNVSYGGPSASQSDPAPPRSQATGERILVVADPVFGDGDARIRDESRNKRLRMLEAMPERLMGLKAQTGVTFPRLPLTGELALQIRKLYPTKTDVLTGISASKPTLTGLDLTRHSTLVFATHSYFGRDLSGIDEPVIVLSLVDQPKGQDGYLRASEVKKFKLNADLVALLSSQSGLGKHVPGKGVESMGNAFLEAGAHSVLVTLWSVSETASVKLGESFFRNLRAGKDKVKALRDAKIEIRKDGYDHPFYWAPFILVGDPN